MKKTARLTLDAGLSAKTRSASPIRLTGFLAVASASTKSRIAIISIPRPAAKFPARMASPIGPLARSEKANAPDVNDQLVSLLQNRKAALYF